ncbi:MAG: Two-component transcriptional response regulator, LuxR family, partial [uncultured Rubrobacteraceae bacterium]
GRDYIVGRRRRGPSGGDLHRVGVGGVPGRDGDGWHGGFEGARGRRFGPRGPGHHAAQDERVRGLEEDAGAERRAGGVAHGQEPIGGQGRGARARGRRLHNQALRHQGVARQDQGDPEAVRARGAGPGGALAAREPGVGPGGLHGQPGRPAVGAHADGVQDPRVVDAASWAGLYAGPDLRGRLDGFALPRQPLHRRPHKQAQGQGRGGPVQAADHTDRAERGLPGRQAGL